MDRFYTFLKANCTVQLLEVYCHAETQTSRGGGDELCLETEHSKKSGEVLESVCLKICFLNSESLVPSC